MNNDLLLKAREKVPDAKTLIILASRRARQLATGGNPMVKTDSDNYLDIALQEIGEGLLEPDFSGKPQDDDIIAQMNAAKNAAAAATASSRKKDN